MVSSGHHGSLGLWQRRFILAVIITVPVLYFLLASALGGTMPFYSQLEPWSNFILFISATIAMLYFGSSFFYSTIRGLKNRMFNTDSLVTIGTTTAYVYSCITYVIYILENKTVTASISETPQLYFSTVVLLFSFVILGKWIEVRATNRSEKSVRQLIKLRPREAHLVNGGNIVTIPADSIKVGDKLLVYPGEVIPIDGLVLRGNSSVNESMVTGESAEDEKHSGSYVIAGTVNGGGRLEIVARRIRSDTLLARIISLINQARNRRTSVSTIADQIANVFVPFVIAIALVTFFVWYYQIGVSLSTAMTLFITVIMVACPYAFGLAQPSAITVGIDVGSKHGILVKDGEAIQQLSRVDTVVFDKTGTLTSGQPIVTDIININSNAKRILTVAYSLELLSEHNLAKAIIKKASQRHLNKLPVKNFAVLPGQGVTGMINSTRYYLGNAELLGKHFNEDLPDVTRLVKNGKTICYLFTEHQILGIIALADQPKVNAAKTIRELNRLHIDVYLISGDSETTTRAIAHRLGIKNIIADIMPDGKANEIIRLRREGRRVAMVGDGINDAPAIASANVGIAIGTGTDAAIETGDIILVNGDPIGICEAIRLCKSTISKSRQNLFFSLFYNIISLPIAAGALSSFGIVFQPELAALIMAMSSIAVLVNSLTLKLVDLHRIHDPSKYITSIILFLLFSVVYIEFVFGSSLHALVSLF